MKRILLENANNMRDLGGYAISLTTSTNYNQYIRSDIVEAISKEEIAYLKKIGIETIIDLRKIEEITRKPNALKPYFNYYNINLLGDKAPQNEKDVATGYIDILSNKETIHEVFKTIAQTKGGVIFNCIAE